MRLLTSQFAFPVTISSFTATLADKNTVLLNWVTRQEINSNRFLVQRSINAIDFTTVGTVKAAGNSSSAINYSFADAQIGTLKTARIYYRLQQIDNDGKVQYSETREVMTSRNANTISLYPNPTSQYLNIKGEGIATVSLYDINGRLVILTNATNRSVNVSQLNEGMYIAVVSKTDGTKETNTIVVKH